jgi:prophage regulatory protein
MSIKEAKTEEHAVVKPRIASPRVVAEMTGLSRTTIWRLGRTGEFPRPIQISAGRVGFLIDEIESWIAEKRTERESWDVPQDENRKRRACT